MAFKMKGKPMHMGTAGHKSALKSIRAVHLANGTDPDHGKNKTSTKGLDEVKDIISGKTEVKQKSSPKEDVSKYKEDVKPANKPKVEKIEGKKATKIETPKVEKKIVKKNKTVKKPDVNNAEDRKKMSHKDIFKAKQEKRKATRKKRQEDRKSKRAKGKVLRAAIDKWRAGGSKGPMPTRSTI